MLRLVQRAPVVSAYVDLGDSEVLSTTPEACYVESFLGQLFLLLLRQGLIFNFFNSYRLFVHDTLLLTNAIFTVCYLLDSATVGARVLILSFPDCPHTVKFHPHDGICRYLALLGLANGIRFLVTTVEADDQSRFSLFVLANISQILRLFFIFISCFD